MAEIAINSISKRFGATSAVDDFSMTVADGEFLVLLGPTGAGKTTVLRVVAGVETCDKGSVVIGGKDVTRASPADRDVAFVFQQYSLYPHLSVFDNMAFPLRSRRRRTPEADIETRVKTVAEMLRIGHKLQNKATQLSGGEMQRVAIGRALVRAPKAFLMDEPLSSLDAKLRSDLGLELKRIQQDLGATLLYVTHDQIEAMTMATRIGVMSEGNLVQIGTPKEIFEEPMDVYVATRLGTPRINILPIGLLPVDAAPSGAAWMGLRTEHMRITADPAGPALVERVEHLGDQTHIYLSLNGQEISALADPHIVLRRGDRARIEPVKPHFFDKAGTRIRV